jgi:GntR family transcriptional regulator/MocR family aminotransferase
VAQRARSQGLELAAVSQFAVRHAPPPGLVLGFAGCAPAELRRGVDVLASLVH